MFCLYRKSCLNILSCVFTSPAIPSLIGGLRGLDLIASCFFILGSIKKTKIENKINKTIKPQMYCVKKLAKSNCGMLVWLESNQLLLS